MKTTPRATHITNLYWLWRNFSKQAAIYNLIHPTHESGDRVRQYVGAQPEKIGEQDSVNRYHEVQELKRILDMHNSKNSTG